TVLHIPLLLMLVGIILRGTAFTFRYYDIGEGEGRGPWTAFFRGGSVMVPMMFGHMVAAMSRGRFSAEPTSVYDAYIHPWVGWFPFATGLFVTALFAWIAAVFLVGEERAERKAPAAARARRWTVLLVPLSGAVTLTAWLEGVPWLVDALRSPLLYGVAILALGSTLVLWRLLDSERLWTVRALAGAVVTSVLAGYWGAVYPTAVQLEGGASIGWHEAAAPNATMNALAVTLIAASLLILPGLAWLYRLFKTPNPEDRGGPVQPS
ncbi:MAG: cytochrome d ubiquinol oxidase subunit II, partial [Myxococcota bacterium]